MAYHYSEQVFIGILVHKYIRKGSLFNIETSNMETSFPPFSTAFLLESPTLSALGNTSSLLAT